MARRARVTGPVDDLLEWKVRAVYEELHNIGDTDGSARAAESAACDVIATVVDSRPDQWDVLLDLLGTTPAPLTCALYTAMGLVLRGPRKVEISRRAWQMRCDLAPMPWLDHIGAAVPTGRASREEAEHGAPNRRFRELEWLIEMDNGLERYCLMTNQDLDTGSLSWCCFFPNVDELERAEREEKRPPHGRVPVALASAIAGMRAAVALPGMHGRSTTVHHLGLWVRWQLSRIDQPVLENLPMIDYV